MSTWSQGNPFRPNVPIVTAGGLPAPKRINSQAKGKRAERDLANWWKTRGYPDAHRAVVTGDRFAPDGGDLVLEHGGFRLVIEVKHHDGGLTDGQIWAYGEKLIKQVKQSKGTMGVLVERRDRVSDAGRWWVHLDPWHFGILTIPRVQDLGIDFEYSRPHYWRTLACRTTVDHFAGLLVLSGYAQDPKEG